MPRSFSGGNFQGRSYSGGNIQQRPLSSGVQSRSFGSAPRGYSPRGRSDSFSPSRNFTSQARSSFDRGARDFQSRTGRGSSFVDRNFGSQSRLTGGSRQNFTSSSNRNRDFANQYRNRDFSGSDRGRNWSNNDWRGRNTVGYRGNDGRGFYGGHRHGYSHQYANYWRNRSYFFGGRSPFGHYLGYPWYGYRYPRFGWGYAGHHGYGVWPWLLIGRFGYGGYGYGGYGYGGYGYGGYGYGYQPVSSYVSYYDSGDGYYPYGAYDSASGYSTDAPAIDATVAAAPADDRGAPSEDQLSTSLDYAAQGEDAFRRGEYSDAIRDWQHALVEDPTNGALVLLMGQGLFASGEYEAAAGAVQQGVQMVPPEKWSAVVSNFEQLYGNMQDYTDQLRALEKASDAKPDNPALRFLLGYHYGYLGYPKQATRELRKAIELAPRDEVAKKMLASFEKNLPADQRPAAAPAGAPLKHGVALPPAGEPVPPAAPPAETEAFIPPVEGQGEPRLAPPEADTVIAPPDAARQQGTPPPPAAESAVEQ